ncbi:hypothetical protein BCR34DRAFT_653365, partial [Clohesyomyces aquaticus]
GDEAHVVAKIHQVTLIVLRFESVIALHRTVLASPKKNSAYNAALQRCISASRSIINTLHKALKGFGAFDGSPGHRGYESMPLLWPSFTWAVWMSTFIIVFGASEGQVSQDATSRLTDRSIEVLKHLSLRGMNWPDACIVAIRNLVARRLDRSRSSTRSSSVEPRPQVQAPNSHSGMSARQSTSTFQRPLRPHSTRLGLESTQYHLPLGSIPQRQYPPPFHAPSSVPTAPGSYLTMLREPISCATSGTASAAGAPSTNLDAFTFHNGVSQNMGYPGISPIQNSRLGGSGTFLGIAQQLSDNPIPNEEIMHLFNGDDMACWMGENFELGGGL